MRYNVKETKFKVLKKSVSLALIFSITFGNNVPLFAKRFDKENFPTSTLSDIFPESYMPYINKIKSEHPSWILKAVNTGLEWNEVVDHESYVSGGDSVSTVHDSLPAEWKKDGVNNYMDGPYVTASKQAVEYVLDPRNSLNDEGIFQFESLTYSQGAHTLSAVDSILANTPMGAEGYKTKYQYQTLNNWINMDKSYSQIILDKAIKYGISPIHVASRIKQENSGDIINGKLINGIYPGYEGYYNFFNIGATPGADGNSSVLNGMITAKDNSWDNPEKAIDAGVSKLKNGYIKYGQDTIYFQKFDVNNPYSNATMLYGSQYMTNIMAPKNEALISYNSYNKQNLLNVSFEFHIPVYNNMPSAAAPYPTSTTTGYFEDDNTWIYLDDTSDYGVDDVFNIRSAPDDSSPTNIIATIRETLEGAENRTKFLRIGKGVGLQWDKIKLDDGREGYVFTGSGFVHEYNYEKVSSVHLNKEVLDLSPDEEYTLIATLEPTNAFVKDVVWSSNNEDIATVDQSGVVRAKKDGNVIITVTTKDGAKTATCIVNVAVKKVESITLDNNEYKIVNGGSIIIEPTILPSTAINKNYSVTIDDENIVEYSDGKFIAKNIGTTKITFITEDSNKSVSATITVVEKEISIDSSLRVEGEYILGINPETKVTQLREKISTPYTLRFLDKDLNELDDENFIGTASKIQVLQEDSVKLEYTVLIYGDITGEGRVNSADLLKIRQHMLESNILEGIFFKAGNISKTDDVINSLDLLKLRQHMLGIVEIEQ